MGLQDQEGYRHIADRTRTKTQSGRVPARSFHISYFLVAWVNHPVWLCSGRFRSAPESGTAADVTACLKRAITRSSQRPSVHLSSFKPRKLSGQKKTRLNLLRPFLEHGKR